MALQAGDEASGHETSGLEQLTFPPIFEGDGQILSLNGVAQTLAYTHTYTVASAQNVAANFTVQAVDRAGNTASSPPFRVEKDESGPILSDLTLATLGGDPGYVHLVPGAQTLYYAPSASGSLQVSLSAADTQSGLNSLTFPDVFAPGDGEPLNLVGQHGPESFQHTYPILGSQVVSATFQVSADDEVGVAALSSAYRVVQDAISPTVAITAPSTAGLTFRVAWGGQDTFSGVRDYNLAYRVEGGDWVGWYTHTLQTSASFVGEKDQSYTFRVQATDNVSTTSAWVESGPVVVNAVTKYYYQGDQRVAMRQGDVVYYLHSDHLGSTSLTTDQNGVPVAETRYYPYGEERWTSGGAVSDYTFTGQRAERGLGLMDYRARYYDPNLGRFVSADTVVPEPGNPQSLNRYSYVNNSPLRFNDPTGHSRPLPPCSICQVEIDTSNWSDLAKGLAVPLSFLTGFHADREQNLVTGPTEQEWMESSLTNMVTPIGMVAQPVQRGARGIQRILPGFEDLVGPKVWQDILKQSPLEDHHILTNKHGTRWTAEFEKILKDYGLDIKDKWNVANIRHPQTGGHPEAYHEWVWEQLQQIDIGARGDIQKFLELFSEQIKQSVEEHPEMLLDEFWEIIGNE